MLSIMLFHQGWLHSYLFKFFGFVGHFGVDMFFFVSGFGIVYSLKKNDTLSFYKRRIIRIFPPLVLFGIIKYLLAKNVHLFNGYMADWTTVFGFGLWFIWVILFFYLISPLLLKIINNRINGFALLLLAVLLISFGGGYQSLPDTMRWGVVRFPAYLMGMLVASGNLKMSDKYIKFGVLFVFLAAVFRFFRYSGQINCTDLYTFLILVFGLPSLCYWLTQINQLFIKCQLSSFFNYMGTRSLELYIVHGFVYWCIKQLVLPNFFGFLIGIFLSIIIAEALYQSKLIVNKLF